MDILRKIDARIILLIAVCIATAIFAKNLDVLSIEYRDDEVRYYKSTQKMLEDNNWMSPTLMGKHRFQKPILFYWLVLVSYKIFGVSWFSARVVASLFAGMTVVLTWLIGRELFDKKTAFLGALILMATPMFFRHAQNVVPDMPLNFFIVLALFCGLKFINAPEQRKYSISFFIACGFGFMIKGFPALIVPILTLILYAFLINKPNILRKINFFRGIVILSLIILPWFLYMITTHGEVYTRHILGPELKGRIFDKNQSNVAWGMLQTFLKNSFFYFKSLIPYFSPWSLCFLFSVPWGIKKVFTRKLGEENFLFLIVWFLSVYTFFSLAAEAKQHYLLILTTPFALLTSCFFLQEFKGGIFLKHGLTFLRKHFIALTLTLSVSAFAFLKVFMAEGSLLWMGGCILLIILLIFSIYKKENLLIAPVALAIFCIFVLGQSKLMADAGLSSHGTLQKLARTINHRITSETAVMTGSYDIHENELQVYFDSPIIKGGWDKDEKTKEYHKAYLTSPQHIYFIILEKDYKNLLLEEYKKSLIFLQEEYIVRKRLNLDTHFILAVLTLKRPIVRNYLFEKVILFEKKPT